MMRSHRGVLALIALAASLATSAPENQQSTTDKTLTVLLYHFSGYAMAID